MCYIFPPRSAGFFFFGVIVFEPSLSAQSMARSSFLVLDSFRSQWYRLLAENATWPFAIFVLLNASFLGTSLVNPSFVYSNVPSSGIYHICVNFFLLSRVRRANQESAITSKVWKGVVVLEDAFYREWVNPFHLCLPSFKFLMIPPSYHLTQTGVNLLAASLIMY